MECEGGWWPAIRPAKMSAAKPMPRDATLGDAIGLAFRQLKNIDDDEHDDYDGDSSDDGSEQYTMQRLRTISAGTSGATWDSPLTRCQPKRPIIAKVDLAQDETTMEIPDGYYYYQKNRNEQTESSEPTLRASHVNVNSLHTDVSDVHTTSDVYSAPLCIDTPEISMRGGDNGDSIGEYVDATKTMKHVHFDLAPDFYSADQYRDVQADWIQGLETFAEGTAMHARFIDGESNEEDTKIASTDKHHGMTTMGNGANWVKPVEDVICSPCGAPMASDEEPWVVTCWCGDLSCDRSCTLGQIQRGREREKAQSHQATQDDGEAAMPLELEEFDCEELHVADAPRVIKIALDSGAGSHVVAPADLEGYTLEPSPASMRGKGFVAANGGRIDNLGQCHLKLTEEGGGRDMRTTVQVADVSRPLMSVSQICDAHPHNRVVCNEQEGVVMRGNTVMARYPRCGGLYVAELQMAEASVVKPAGFRGPGNKR